MDKKKISIDGKEIAYRQQGSGEPIVFLHGTQLRLIYGEI